jgi:predicted DNA-binding transcriptional regulator YafY
MVITLRTKPDTRGVRLELRDLARDLGVSTRTVARDVERLRLSGVPLHAHRGRGGGVSLSPARTRVTVTLDLPEVAALMSSLAVLGPSVSESAASAMRKLTGALHSDGPPQRQGVHSSARS